MIYNKPCIIKIWYWNYRDINNRYSADNKQIHFEILQDNDRQILLTYKIPSFLNGHDMVNNFIKDKYEILKFIPKLNYDQSFDSSKLKYEMITIESGNSDKRFNDLISE